MTLNVGVIGTGMIGQDHIRRDDRRGHLRARRRRRPVAAGRGGRRRPGTHAAAQPAGGRVPADWRERFARAYDAELQDWIDAASAGTATGPSSWGGYAATVASGAGVQALRGGTRVEVSMRRRPDLYRRAAAAAGPAA